MTEAMIRLATEADAPRILEIYGPIVRETAISFEYEVPSVEEMQSRIRGKLEHGYPWLVMERAGVLMGYSYAGRWRDRSAYDWVVETTIYVNSQARRSGVGRTLYAVLFDVLRWQGFVEAVAGATLPNEGSVGLHHAVGFHDMGVKHKAGYKFGQWHDVGFFEMTLQDAPAVPQPTRDVRDLVGTDAWKALIAR